MSKVHDRPVTPLVLLCVRGFVVSLDISVTSLKMAATELQAGYECSFVAEQLGKLELLQSECFICLHILREPYLVGCCGYRFCRNCIEPIQKTTRRCPLCNNAFSTLPDRQLERVLKEALVYCSNRDGNSGCKWEGKLVDFEKHVKSCTWKKVQCPHCHESFTQYNLTKFHIGSCSQRKIACTYCKTHQDTQSQLKAVHYAVCPMYPVPCPNNCGAKPFRKNIAKHVDDSCPLTVTECFFKHAGCDAQLTRRDMKQHADNLAEHLAMSISKIMSLKNEVEGLEKELESKNHLLESRDRELVSKQTAESNPTKYLTVTNLPDCVNAWMLQSVFGQYGCVMQVNLIESMRIAVVEYSGEYGVQRALTRSKQKGINLKGHRLCVTPVNQPE